MEINNRNYYLLTFIIILFGFCLRVYQLGNASFWNDEAGQALAATQTTVSEMVTIIKSHAMAMPLDYFVTRMFSKLGTTEFILKFPSALWGTLTLGLCFVFIKKYYETKISLFAVWLLTINPQLIHYSQELRFYSALIFFYALSNLCLFRAVSQSLISAWLVYSIVTAIGAYFHPYVLLNALNGFLYLAVFRQTPSIYYKKIIALIISILLSGMLLLPGYLYFGAQQKFNYELLQWGGPLHFIIFAGVGWRAMHYCKTTFGMWELLNVGGVSVGLLLVISQYKKNRILLSMAIGAFIQIGIIIFTDWMKGYWFLSRQIVYLIPTMIILVAVGYVSLLDHISRLFKAPAVKSWCLLIIITLFTLSSIPRIADYYQFSKSTGREIVCKLLESHREGEQVFVIPAHEETIYRFYLSQTLKGQKTMKELRPSRWEDLPSAVKGLSNTAYLIAPLKPLFSVKKQQEILKSLQFNLCFIPEKRSWLTRVLYVREKIKRLE